MDEQTALDYQVPKNWAWTKLRDNIEWGTGGTPSRSRQDFFGGPIPWLKTGDLTNGVVRYTSETLTEAGLKNSNAKWYPKGAVVIALYGATIGKLGLLEIASTTNQACAVAVVSKTILNKYLFYYLLSQQPNFVRLGFGGAQPNISQSLLKNYPFPLPPLLEQKRIVKKLDSLLDKIKKARKLIEQAKSSFADRRAAILARAFRGELTVKWREANTDLEPADSLLKRIKEAHSKYTDKRGNAASPTSGVHNLAKKDLATGWEIIELKFCVEPKRPITYGILKPGPNIANGVPYVKVKNYPKNEIVLTDIPRTTSEIANEYKRAQIRTNDLLLSIRGTVGRVCCVPSFLDGGNITQDSARLSIMPILLYRYVQYALQEPMIQNRMAQATKGVAVRGINIGDVRALQIPLPPLAEQKEIVRTLDLQLRAHEQSAEELKLENHLNLLEKSILARAFRGELGTGNPNDEPVEKLLKRIRNENAQGDLFENQTVSARKAKSKKPRAPRAPRGKKRKSSSNKSA